MDDIALKHIKKLIGSKDIYQLANSLEISVERLLAIYNNSESPNPNELRKLMKYFNVSFDYLCGLQDEKGNDIIYTSERTGYVKSR